VIVQQDVTTAYSLVITSSNALTCLQPTSLLTGQAVPSVGIYSWTGPGGFSASGQQVSVSAPGVYTLTVTNPGNGCTVSGSVMVTQNITPPSVIASVSGTLSCETPVATLNAVSTTPNATYWWLGPDDFFSPQQNAETSVPGTYFVEVTNPVNSCTSIASVEVTGSPDCFFAARSASANNALGGDVAATTTLYPNPVNDHGTLQFTAPQDGQVKVEVYTLFNVKAATLFESPGPVSPAREDC
jgi:hypothetical protein